MYRHLMTEREAEIYQRHLAALGFNIEFNSNERVYNRNLGILVNPGNIEQLDFHDGYRQCKIYLASEIDSIAYSDNIKVGEREKHDKYVGIPLTVTPEVGRGSHFLGALTIGGKQFIRVSCWWNSH